MLVLSAAVLVIVIEIEVASSAGSYRRHDKLSATECLHRNRDVDYEYDYEQEHEHRCAEQE